MQNTIQELERELSRSATLEPLGSPVQTFSQTGRQVLPRAKVLIVDDEPDIVTSLTKRLRFAGYDTCSARDGMEATSVAIKMRPDVIVLDIGMPCGDGHTVADRIRSNTRTMFAQVNFLTARVSEVDRQKAMQAGAYGYLTKPFKSDELVQMIENALADSSF